MPDCQKVLFIFLKTADTLATKSAAQLSPRWFKTGWLRNNFLNVERTQFELAAGSGRFCRLPNLANHQPPKVRAATPRQHTPHPSKQVDPDSATIPSNPSPASTRREPRSLNLEMLSTIHGSRSVDHGPICLDLGPRTVVHGCYPDCYPK